MSRASDPNPLARPDPVKQPEPVEERPLPDEARKEQAERDANADAITGAPGSHPVGTGIGAAAAGAAGAVIGSAVPGVGTAVGGAVGAAIGAVAGGYAGKAVAEAINPSDEAAYWRTAHRQRDYYRQGETYDQDYEPAYAVAVTTYNVEPHRPFDQAEKELEQRWQEHRKESRLDWPRARLAMQDVYERDRTGQGTKATGTSESTVSQ